jgi:hypothetical protein
MRVLVVGSTNWKNYNEVMRNMTLEIEDIAVKDLEDKKIVFVHTGLRGAENMVTEYLGKVEKFLRQKGYSVKEELFRAKWNGNSLQKVTADYDMITSGIDHAMVFLVPGDKRAEYCIRILKEVGIATVLVKEV